jgi:twitching motility protein PilJ
MSGIQDVTTQTAAGTERTSQSIGNLARLAQDLDKSVAGFKLPQ